MAVETVGFIVNGRDVRVQASADTPLLYVLRNDLDLKGTKFGCGDGLCGACMVHIDGRKAFSCDTPIEFVASKSVTTVEALVASGAPDPLVIEFEKAHAYQCGYCTAGLLMAARALLDENPAPSRDDIKAALDDNLCRCGVHMRVVRAVEAVVQQGGT